jgi:hypothetical protein
MARGYNHESMIKLKDGLTWWGGHERQAGDGWVW